ncbi:hypothetical protein T261_8240 [Streptomyces lydicus]|nr:hypothetical protein T261_8240 [Streptomyces lydicus]
MTSAFKTWLWSWRPALPCAAANDACAAKGSLAIRDRDEQGRLLTD